MTPDFDKAHYAATELLLQQTLNSLRVDTRAFKFNVAIRIDSIQNYAHLTDTAVTSYWCDEISGCCVLVTARDEYLILYDDSEKNPKRKHWGITHEIGHIYLHHDCDDKKSEIEAHYFAAQIVTPEIALVECAKRSGRGLYPDEIASTFNTSVEAASKRLATLSKRACYNSAPKDMALLEKLEPFIAARYPL